MKEKLCIECKSPRQTGSSFCSKECERVWDRRRKNKAWKAQITKQLTCVVCSTVFEHKDSRKKTCGPKCAYALRAKKMKENLGYENPSQNMSEEAKLVRKQARVKQQKTIQKQDPTWGQGLGLSTQYATDRGFSSIEAFGEAIIQTIEVENCAPHSELITKKYNCSTFVIGSVIKLLKREDLLHNSYRQSIPEKQIYSFLTEGLQIPESQIQTNTRPDFMKGLELDLYLPDFKVAIEYHGLVHHSERPIFGPKDIHKVKTQHETKYLWAKAAGVKLIQIFEDEWRDKPDLLKAMIKARLGLVTTKIHARKCEVIEITNKESISFFNNNHVSGHTNSVKTFALRFEGEIVSMLSLRKTWNKTYGENIMELARFASKQDVMVIGGFSRLLKQAEDYIKAAQCGGLLTYADCRFGEGGVYQNNGFVQLTKTKPNYFYEQHGIRENRFKHRKSKELIGKTEREQQNGLGWYAIYDAGNEVYFKNVV